MVLANIDLLFCKSKFSPGICPPSLFLSQLLKCFRYLPLSNSSSSPETSVTADCWVSAFTFPVAPFLSTRFSSMARNAGAPLTLKPTCSLPRGLVRDSNSCALQTCARYGYFGFWKYLENSTRRWVSARENQILSLFMQKSRPSDYKMIWIIEYLLTNCCLDRKWVIRTKI